MLQNILNRARTWPPGYPVAGIGILLSLMALYLAPILTIDFGEILGSFLGFFLGNAMPSLKMGITFAEAVALMGMLTRWTAKAGRFLQEFGLDTGGLGEARLLLWGLRFTFWGTLASYGLVAYALYRREQQRLDRETLDIWDVTGPGLSGLWHVLLAFLLLILEPREMWGSGIWLLLLAGFFLVSGGGMHFWTWFQKRAAMAPYPYAHSGHPPSFPGSQYPYAPPPPRRESRPFGPASAPPPPPGSASGFGPPGYPPAPSAARGPVAPTDVTEDVLGVGSPDDVAPTELYPEGMTERMRAWLLSADGRRYPVPLPEATVGRSPGNTIVLKHGSVSKRHARITYHNGQFWLEDLHSTNGTEVNGERIRGQRIVLPPGAHIRFGTMPPMRFEIER